MYPPHNGRRFYWYDTTLRIVDTLHSVMSLCSFQQNHDHRRNNKVEKAMLLCSSSDAVAAVVCLTIFC